jgi:cytochrome c
VYDYVRRAMPLTAPGSLEPHVLYSLTAFLLAENEVIDKTAVMDAKTLPAVRMPARGRFVPDDRRDGSPAR